MLRRILLLLGLSVPLGACQINPITTPARGATEEMLISSAADRAADKLAGLLPADLGSVFVDAAFPEIALYSAAQEEGVAKFAAVAYSAETGGLVVDRPPEYGYSHHLKRTVLLFVSRQEQNYRAEADKDPTE
jgi:hypothetical protein